VDENHYSHPNPFESLKIFEGQLSALALVSFKDKSMEREGIVRIPE